MKFRVRKPGARYRALHMWHSWFAWHPCRVPTKGKMSGMTMVWLENVKRKGKCHNFQELGVIWCWAYK